MNPCPFCGSENICIMDGDHGGKYVKCCSCEARGPLAYYPDEDAVELWDEALADD